jgi:methylated-DNA-[protein]-cysteine S-methyltransferase
LIAEDGALCALRLPNRLGQKPEREDPRDPVLRACAAQLSEYFAGCRQEFELALSLTGTPFQKVAWRALQRIPFGQTRSYGEQARAIARPQAFRAVGGANHRNPIAIIVPCHRVIGSDGSLTGYGGGEPLKRWLLEHEARVLATGFARTMRA